MRSFIFHHFHLFWREPRWPTVKHLQRRLLPKNVKKKEINKCCHCKKSVTEVVKCRKCGNSFHPACLTQASRLRSAECVHVTESKVRSGSVVDCDDTQKLLLLRTLVKELQSKNQILEENCLLREKVSNLEEKLKISKDTLENHKHKQAR